jgi:hypothetical protein
MRWLLPLVANGSPALLNDRWLVRIVSDYHSPDVRHELEFRLNLATPPTVPVDFLTVIWRMYNPGARGVRVCFPTFGLPMGAIGGPAAPPVGVLAEYNPEAPQGILAADDERGVTFQLEVRPVWKPDPRP